MPGDLDDILVSTDCPRCGATISAPWGQVRLSKAMACSCGALIRVEDATPLSAMQAVIDEANPMVGEND